MKAFSDNLYKELQEAVQQCREAGGEAISVVEACYRVSFKFWVTLQEAVALQGFTTDEEEIYFFKCVKPRFCAEIEYHSLVYHSVLFQPTDPVAAQDFWNREAARFEKWKGENNIFYTYYQQQCVHNDEHYFLKRNLKEEDRSIDKRLDLHLEQQTVGDRLATVLLALARYKEYACSNINRFDHD